ncbi:MAG: 50S ribosomal protein L11 methyltransferase [Bacteroidaceae bacterium]|nr:50S ribosomal protein L11 methyltransferase [Bacteroidaceae bacterium]
MKYFEVKCTLQPFSVDAADVLSAVLAEIGFESFSEQEDGVLAYIQQSEWDEERMQKAIQNFILPDVSISYTCAEAPDEDWNQIWEEEGFQPIILPLGGGQEGAIVVHDVKHTDVPPAQYDILITPRLAFGTGSHQTTRLILRTLASLDLEGKRVIDAGTGTGILAIMAIKRGAASVFAYDIDEWSVENTKDNLLLNGRPPLTPPCKGRTIYSSPYKGEVGRGSVVVVCGDSSVLEGQEKADLLIANINRNILLQDLPRFAKAVKPQGMMILSGFYLSDVSVLTEAAVQQGFSLLKTESEGEWAMLLFEADALGGRDV